MAERRLKQFTRCDISGGMSSQEKEDEGVPNDIKSSGTKIGGGEKRSYFQRDKNLCGNQKRKEERGPIKKSATRERE